VDHFDPHSLLTKYYSGHHVVDLQLLFVCCLMRIHFNKFVIKSRIMRRAGHVELTGGRTGMYRVWRGDVSETDRLQNLDVDGMIILK